MSGKRRFTRMELLVLGSTVVMADGLVAIFFAAALNGPRIEG